MPLESTDGYRREEVESTGEEDRDIPAWV